MLKHAKLLITGSMFIEYIKLIEISVRTGGFGHEARGYGLQGFRGWGNCAIDYIGANFEGC